MSKPKHEISIKWRDGSRIQKIGAIFDSNIPGLMNAKLGTWNKEQRKEEPVTLTLADGTAVSSDEVWVNIGPTYEQRQAMKTGSEATSQPYADNGADDIPF